MSLLSVEEVERGLIAQGVPPQRARAAALAQRYEAQQARAISPIDHGSQIAPIVEELAMPQIQWPFRLTIPWSYLVSDNAKYAPALRGTKAVLILTEQYRRAKHLTHDHARDTLGQPKPEPASIPLSLEAAVWVPDYRIHDCANFAKCCADALEGTVYTKDRWLKRVLWYEAGVDVDRPRAEITIQPLVL